MQLELIHPQVMMMPPATNAGEVLTAQIKDQPRVTLALVEHTVCMGRLHAKSARLESTRQILACSIVTIAQKGNTKATWDRLLVIIARARERRHNLLDR